MNNWMAWGGFAAVGAFVTATWRFMLGMWQYASSILIVRVMLHEEAARAMLAHCHTNFKTSPFGERNYMAWRDWVRPRQRYERIGAEEPGRGGRVYWRGWRPLWLGRQSASGNPSADNTVVMAMPVSVTFIRGMYDADTLVLEALDFINARIQDGGHSRYYVRYMSGTVGQYKGRGEQGAQDGKAPTTEGRSSTDLLARRLLQWTYEDIGPAKHAGRAMDDMALSADMENVLIRLRRWRDGRDWFFDRGLPWKYGCMFYGEPGNGKTAFCRALAEDLNLPVFSFDLPTMLNDELRQRWQSMRSEAPAVALIEDIDGVFHGREKANDEILLTFDALLNCIDGVERSAGILLFVTTNKIELVDPAIGGPTEEGKLPKRPGRIDCSVFCGNPGTAGRQQIARRILRDWPQVIDSTVEAGQNDTGAQFERRCINMAEDLFWKDDQATFSARAFTGRGYPTETTSISVNRNQDHEDQITGQGSHAANSALVVSTVQEAARRRG